MPDLLGATNPVPGHESGQIARNVTVPPDSPRIPNVVDPNRVTRTDQRTEQQDHDLQGEGQVRYDSNFQTFLQQLRDTPGMAQTLARIFSGREGTVVLSGMSDGTAAEMSKILEMLRMDQDQLLDFLSGQSRAGTRFSGALFTLLRNAYRSAASETVRTDILQFLRSYADYSSTDHIQGNLLRQMREMADAMPASWAEKLRDLLSQLENSVAAGDRQGGLQLIQREVFPYMAAYVERTHDMGLPRALLSMMALDVSRYENGSEEKLLESFHQLSGYSTLKSQLGRLDDRSLLALLQDRRQDASSRAIEFSDSLVRAAARALRGDGSAEIQQSFQDLVRALLINESVYMPVNHYLLPLEQDGRRLFSEMWVDPDAEEDKSSGGRRGNAVKLLIKIDVQSLGLFDVVLTSRDGDVDIQIACPPAAASFSRQIQESVTNILERNDLRPSRVLVRRMDRPVALTEVFPKIFEGMNSINVKA